MAPLLLLCLLFYRYLLDLSLYIVYVLPGSPVWGRFIHQSIIFEIGFTIMRAFNAFKNFDKYVHLNSYNIVSRKEFNDVEDGNMFSLLLGLRFYRNLLDLPSIPVWGRFIQQFSKSVPHTTILTNLQKIPTEHFPIIGRLWYHQQLY